MTLSSAQDVFWILFASVLVLLMQAGFLCLESGLTRSKNAINVAMKNAADVVLTLLVWWLFSYGLMFGEGSAWWGLAGWWPDFVSASAWEISVFLFQFLFAATAVTIVSGAVAERTRFHAYLLISLLVVLLIYPLFGRWSWGGLLHGQAGWLQQLGFIDFAGSTVVHSVGGWVALAAVLVIGPRYGRYEYGRTIPASSLPIAMLGVLLLMIGWLGFNGGSTLEFNHKIPLILVNTLLAAAAAGATGYALMLLLSERFSETVTTPLNSVLGGLVAITAGCHLLDPAASVWVGAVAGVIVVLGSVLLTHWRIDDVVGAIPVHLFSGIWGTLALALFADPQAFGQAVTHWQQFQIQLLGVAVAFVWSFPVSFVLLKLIDRFYALRVPLMAELEGLNVSEHRANTDLVELLEAMHKQQQSPEAGQRLPVEPFTEVGMIAREHNRLMDELESTMAKNSAILNDLGDGVLTITADGVITSCNPAAGRMLGAELLAIVDTPLDHWLLVCGQEAQQQSSVLLNHFLTLGEHEACFRRIHDGRRLELQISVSDSSEQQSEWTCLLHDYSERKKMEQALFEAKEQAQVTLDSIADGVISADERGHVRYLNSRAEELTGWELEEAKGQPLYRVYPVVNSPKERPDQRLAQRIMSMSQNRFEANTLYLYHRDGSVRAVRNTMAPIRNRDDQTRGAVVVFQDVTEAHQLQRKLNYQATHDALTGLVNRREFELRVQALLEGAQERAAIHMLFFIDLDQFKIVNDMCGHAAGDELLRQISKRLHSHLRHSDTLARLGGDEFGVILPQCNSDKALEIAEHMRADIKAFRLPRGGREFAVGTSIGLVQIDEHSESLSQVLNLADAACYSAKKDGRNRVQLANLDDVELKKRSQQQGWVTRIQEALDKDRFRLYYQEIHPALFGTKETRHFEILLRMIDTNGEEISPGTFIPAAERYHLMAEIDEWVVTNTLQWLHDHPQQAQHVDICAINLSGESVGREGFLQHVQAQILASKIRPQQLCFEITETEAIADLDKARHFISALKKMGCQFALDDFGSGLSSFGYLRNLEVDYLKIDGIFIKDIHTNNIDYAMVQAINTIGHVMGLKTIAEFVTTEAAQNALQELGIDYLQGYLLHRPQPLSDLSQVRE